MEMRSLTIGWSWLEPTAAREDDLANCDCPDVNALDVVMAVDSAAGRLTLCVSLLLMESWQSVDDRMPEMSAWCCFTLRSLGLKATTHHLHFNSRIPGESGLPGSPWLSSSSCIRTEPFKVTGTSCSISQIRFVSPNKWCQSTDWMQQQTSNCSHQFLPPSCCTSRTQRNICSVFEYGPLAPSFKNMTSSTKPKVHSVLHCHHRRTESWP